MLGFEYGFSTATRNALVLWEAQFGDFVNVAQPIIDQFIVADRAKWGQDNGLVMLLPHGYEGQGPEHSSARPERLLQAFADINLRVVNCTTTAQYFHLLRRQARHAEMRPLILMTPKSLLRLPAATSRLEELATGRFRPVLDDAAAAERRDAITRLVLCSGKVYYDLVSSAARKSAADVAILRLEKLYPLPEADLRAVLKQYPNVKDLVWVQEEPRNKGAWRYIDSHAADVLPGIRYVGRPERASSAEGYHEAHLAEQGRIVAEGTPEEIALARGLLAGRAGAERTELRDGRRENLDRTELDDDRIEGERELLQHASRNGSPADLITRQALPFQHDHAPAGLP